MNTIENCYRLLKIRCDRYGMPIEKVSDTQIQNAYLKCLKEFFIGVYDNAEKIDTENLSKEEIKEKREQRKYQIIMQAKAKKEYLQKQLEALEGKDFKIKKDFIETMIITNTSVRKNINLMNFYNKLTEAFRLIGTTTAREQYNEHLNRITNKRLIDALNEYTIDTPVRKMKADNNIDYGDLKVKNQEIDFIYTGKNIIIFSEEEYQCLKITETEKINDIKQKGQLSSENIKKYTLLIRKDNTQEIDEKDKQWQSTEFYSNSELATKLGTPIEKTRDPKKASKRKNELLRGLLTVVLQENVINRKKYIGNLSLTPGGVVCTQDRKMENRINQLEESKKQKRYEKKTTFEGER